MWAGEGEPEGGSPLGFRLRLGENKLYTAGCNYCIPFMLGNKQFPLYYPHCNANDLFRLASTSPGVGAYPGAAPESVGILACAKPSAQILTFNSYKSLRVRGR